MESGSVNALCVSKVWARGGHMTFDAKVWHSASYNLETPDDHWEPYVFTIGLSDHGTALIGRVSGDSEVDVPDWADELGASLKGESGMSEELAKIRTGCDVMHDVFGHGVVLEYAAPFEISVRFDDVAAGERRMHLFFAPVTIHRDGIEIEFRGALPEEPFDAPEPPGHTTAPDRAVETTKRMDALQRLAETGNSQAMLSLGAHCEQTGNQELARQWYERSSACGNAEGARVVGAFAMGDGDEAGARESWMAAAAGGNTWAMRDLGDLDRKAGDIAAATSWFVQAAEGGNAWAMKDLGDLADQRGDESTAREWWLRAVDADFSDNGLSPSSAEVALRQLAERTGDLELLARLGGDCRD